MDLSTYTHTIIIMFISSLKSLKINNTIKTSKEE